MHLLGKSLLYVAVAVFLVALGWYIKPTPKPIQQVHFVYDTVTDTIFEYVAKKETVPKWHERIKLVPVLPRSIIATSDSSKTDTMRNAYISLHGSNLYVLTAHTQQYFTLPVKHPSLRIGIYGDAVHVQSQRPMPHLYGFIYAQHQRTGAFDADAGLVLRYKRIFIGVSTQGIMAGYIMPLF